VKSGNTTDPFDPVLWGRLFVITAKLYLNAFWPFNNWGLLDLPLSSLCFCWPKKKNLSAHAGFLYIIVALSMLFV